MAQDPIETGVAIHRINAELIEISIVLEVKVEGKTVQNFNVLEHHTVKKDIDKSDKSNNKEEIAIKNGKSGSGEGEQIFKPPEITDPIVIKFIEAIRSAISSIIQKFTEKTHTSGNQQFSTIYKQNIEEKQITWQAMCMNYKNFTLLRSPSEELKCEAETVKFLKHFVSKSSLDSKVKAVEIGIEFFLELWKKLFNCLRSLKHHKFQEDSNMTKSASKEKVTPKLKHLNEVSHALESSLRTLARLTPVYGCTYGKQTGQENKNYCLSTQKGKIPRDSHVVSKIVENFLRRNDDGCMSSYHLPHIHHVMLDKDMRAKEQVFDDKAQAKMDLGLFHTAWKEKIRNEHFLDPTDLYNYLWQFEECRTGGNIFKCSLLTVIRIFLEEYALNWNEQEPKLKKHFGSLGNEFRGDAKESSHHCYPKCHFCGKEFIEAVQPFKEFCCTDGKTFALIKQHLGGLFDDETLAVWKKSLLFDISDEIAHQKVLRMVEEGRNFLKSTAHKMNFTYAEIAKILLAVALGRQRKGSTGDICSKDEIHSESLTSTGTDIGDEDAGKGIVGSEIEPFWRRVLAASEDLSMTNLARGRGTFGALTESKESSYVYGKDVLNQEDFLSGRSTRENGISTGTGVHRKKKMVEGFEDDAHHEKKRKKDASDKENEKEYEKTLGWSKKTKSRGKGKGKMDKYSDDQESSTNVKKGKHGEVKEKLSKKKTHGKDSKAHSERSKKGGGIGEEDSMDMSLDKISKISKNKSSKQLKEKDKSDGKSSSRSKQRSKGKDSQMNDSTFAKQIEKTGAKIFGYIPYRLSDMTNADNAWNYIPRVIHTKDVAVYQALQKKKALFWCADSLIEEHYTYLEGTAFAILRCDGTGEVFYPDGRPAITISKEGEKIVVAVFSMHQEIPNFISLAGKFDSYGHGIIYDSDGQVRMQFTQSWGFLRKLQCDKVMRWKWGVGRIFDIVHEDSLKVRLAQTKSINEESSAKIIENESQQKKKCELKNPYCPLPFLIIRINPNIIFRLFDQSDMCLIFEACYTCIRLDFGAIVDARRVAYYDSMVDHELEKDEELPQEMASIHDRVFPPPPLLPSEIIRAPYLFDSTRPRKGKHLFLHRAVVFNPGQEC